YRTCSHEGLARPEDRGNEGPATADCDVGGDGDLSRRPRLPQRHHGRAGPLQSRARRRRGAIRDGSAAAPDPDDDGRACVVQRPYRALTRRVPLILARAVARLSGGAARPAEASRWSGVVVSTTPEDGALLVETSRGLSLLVLASDAVTRDGARVATGLDDLTAGDVVEWQAEHGDGIVLVQEVVRLAAVAV